MEKYYKVNELADFVVMNAPYHVCRLLSSHSLPLCVRLIWPKKTAILYFSSRTTTKNRLKRVFRFGVYRKWISCGCLVNNIFDGNSVDVCKVRVFVPFSHLCCFFSLPFSLHSSQHRSLLISICCMNWAWIFRQKLWLDWIYSLYAHWEYAFVCIISLWFLFFTVVDSYSFHSFHKCR